MHSNQQLAVERVTESHLGRRLSAIILANVFWGLSFISLKVTLVVIPPMTLALLRFLIALVILIPLIKKVDPDAKLARKDIPIMIVTGLLGVTAYYYFQNNGVKMTTASTASMILAAIPILTVIGEAFVYKTQLSSLKIISVILSILGVYSIVATSEQTSSDSLIGNLFMLAAAVSWVAYTLITRSLGERYSLLAVVTYQTIFGTAALVPFSLMEVWDWHAVNSSILLHLVYLGICCSALANYLYVYAMEELGLSRVSLFINLIPVVSVIGGLVFLQEAVSGMQILGGAIILFSVYLVNRNLSSN